MRIDLSILMKTVNTNNNILKQLIKLEIKTMKDQGKRKRRERTSSPKFLYSAYNFLK